MTLRYSANFTNTDVTVFVRYHTKAQRQYSRSAPVVTRVAEVVSFKHRPSSQAGHEDAMLSFRDASVEKIMRLAEWVRKLKGSVKPPEAGSKKAGAN